VSGVWESRRGQAPTGIEEKKEVCEMTQMGWKILICCCLLALMLVGPAGAAVNLFDPNFANGYENGTFIPTLFKGGSETQAPTTNFALDGTYSLNITLSGTAYEGFGIPITGLTGGQSYTASTFCRNSTGQTIKVYPSLYEYLPNGTSNGVTTGTPYVLTNTWQRFVVTRTLQVPSTNARFYVQDWSAGNTSSFYCDDSQFQLGSTVTPWENDAYNFTSNVTRGYPPLAVQFTYTGPVV
jgi:PKD repeat protein